MAKDSASRTFEDKPASRERVPLLIGLVGPSSSGKTFSALRIATGIQRVCGGDIGVIDTEAKRSLHYADRFKFRHLPFGSPFGPLDYLAAIEHFADKGVRNIIVDSMSHEHEGPGGVLEMHAAELERLSKGDSSRAERVNFVAWQKPKAERRRLLNTVIQMPVNFIFCFRAKEKLKLNPRATEREDKVKQLGWMPIGGEEFVYEMTLNCLLYPNSGGVPSWHPEELGEKAIIKLPEQFKAILARQEPLSEDIGEQLAQWAEGGSTKEPRGQSERVSAEEAKRFREIAKGSGVPMDSIKAHLADRGYASAADILAHDLPAIEAWVRRGGATEPPEGLFPEKDSAQARGVAR